MTQSFHLDYNKYQSLNVPMTTTVEGGAEKKPLADYGIRQLNFRSNYQHLHRVFIEEFDWGGRFFGAVHIDMPKEVRDNITINGSPTVELDYSAHHVRMLYNWEYIPYDKDPYEELCQTSEERPIYKKVVLVSINAKDENNAIYATIDELRDEGFKGDCLKYNYIRDCLNRFKEYHKPISDYLCNDIGIELQYADSRITEQILYQMVSKGIPTLPVHDSFIIPADYEKLLYEVMINSYRKIMGNYEPIIH